MSDEITTGSCACGRVRFEADAPSKFVANCWCENCRRAHGAAFVTWVGFPRESFRVVRGEQDLRHWTTPTGATRSSCSACGSTLLYRSPRWPDETHVAAANLDRGPAHAPTAHVYADRAPDWCPILDDLPRRGGEDGVTPLDD
jgi:hypothetical protein